MALSRARRNARAVAVFLVVQMTVFFGGCANRLILFPSRGAVRGAEALERREIAVPAGVLEVWVARSRPAQPVTAYVLAFDGNASRAEFCAPYLASMFADRSVEIWAVNYPGYGGSSGDAELDAMAPSGLAAYDELARVSGGKPVAVYGNSIGTTVALHVAANRPVAGALLQNPPPLRRLILQRHGWWNLWLVAVPVALSVPAELDSVASAERVRVPGVFVTSKDDDTIPPSYQDHVFEAYAGPKRRIFTAGGHNDGAGSAAVEEIRAATAEWMR